MALIVWVVGSASCVAADEVWDTQDGLVRYLADGGDVAIFELSKPEGTRRMYIPQLTGNFDRRSVHDGYWIGERGTECGGHLTGPDGFAGKTWGRVKLVFHASAFPTDWTMLFGSCFEAPAEPLRGLSPLNK